MFGGRRQHLPAPAPRRGRSFFARQIERVQCRPHGGDTNFDAAIAFHPLHQLGEGHVGMGGHVAGKNVKMVIEFAPGAGRLSARSSRSREDAAAPAPCRCTIRSPRTAARSHRPDRPDPPPTPRGLSNLPSKPVQIPSPSPSSSILGTTEQESLFAPFVNPPMIPVRLKAL